jgi:hypothetical protein
MGGILYCESYWLYAINDDRAADLEVLETQQSKEVYAKGIPSVPAHVRTYA